MSLTARLTLLFATGSCVVLLALGWLISVSIEHHFEDLDRDALTGKLMLAQHVIERVRSVQDLERLPAQLSDAIVGHHDLIIRILGPGREVLLSSSDLEFPAQAIKQAARPAASQVFAWSQGEHSYRGLVGAIPTAIASWPPLVVAVAVDIGHHTVFMQTFMRTLWLFVVCAAAASGLLGWLAASRGLAPLRTMRERAALVTAQRLDQRLPIDAVPRELADLARTLNEMLARLEDAFKRLSDFSSDIAHELRTPVSNLMTQTQVSLARARDATSYREILESNAEEFERLARMIADMLFLAKAESALATAHLISEAEDVDLAQEVRNLFAFYEALADEKGIGLVLAGAGHIVGNRLMLRRAVSNLLSNALRHTPRGGAVKVSIEDAENQTVLAVENPGETVAPEHVNRLFERFYRADPSRHISQGEGTGLGLAITQAIVRAHSGQVGVTSAAGSTCFTLLFKPSQRPRSG
jgi:two-component system heavy metal sensor histidine kinase CusS